MRYKGLFLFILLSIGPFGFIAEIYPQPEQSLKPPELIEDTKEKEYFRKELWGISVDTFASLPESIKHYIRFLESYIATLEKRNQELDAKVQELLPCAAGCASIKNALDSSLSVQIRFERMLMEAHQAENIILHKQNNVLQEQNRALQEQNMALQAKLDERL